MLHHNGRKSLLAIPSDTARDLVEKIITNIDQDDKTPLVRRPQQREQLILVLFNLLRRNCIMSFRKNENGQASVCLPRGPQFYSGEYLESHPYLKEVLGKGKLTYRVAINIIKWLTKHGIVNESTGQAKLEYKMIILGCMTPKVVNGKGRITKVFLNPLNSWARTDTKYLYFSLVAEINSIMHPKLDAVLRIPNETGRGITEIPASEQSESLVRHINQYTDNLADLPEGVKRMMQYRLIFGEHEASHARLYAPLTFMKRDERQQLLSEIGYVEHDISACAANICFAIHTGKFFESNRHQDDIYSALLEDIIETGSSSAWGLRKNKKKMKALGVKQLRPLMKMILTVASGKSCQTMAEVRSTISAILFGNGLLVNMRPVKALEKKFVKENEYLGIESANTLSPEQSEAIKAEKIRCRDKAAELWQHYCQENGLPSVPVDPSWKFQPIELINILRNEDGEYNVLWKMLFRGSFKHTQSVETMANLCLHEWAISKGIHVHTLHDAVYCRPEYSSLVERKQKEFILLAAQLKRKELMLIEKYHHIVRDIESITIPKDFEDFKTETDSKLKPLWDKGREWVYKPTDEENKELNRGFIEVLTSMHSTANDQKNRKTITEIFFTGLSAVSSKFFDPSNLVKNHARESEKATQIKAVDRWNLDDDTKEKAGCVPEKDSDQNRKDIPRRETFNPSSILSSILSSLSYRITSDSLWRDTKLLWYDLAWN